MRFVCLVAKLWKPQVHDGKSMKRRKKTAAQNQEWKEIKRKKITVSHTATTLDFTLALGAAFPRGCFQKFVNSMKWKQPRSRNETRKQKKIVWFYCENEICVRSLPLLNVNCFEFVCSSSAKYAKKKPATTESLCARERSQTAHTRQRADREPNEAIIQQ